MRGSAEGDFYLLGVHEVKVPEGRQANPHAVLLLKESIARVGVINPVTLAHDHTLVAGMNRLEACRELGRESVPVIVLCEGEELREIEMAENLARLHLTQEQLAELRSFEARLLAEKQETKSLRAAAAEVGVPTTTALRRRTSGRDGATVPPGTVALPKGKRRGRDGKRRPAKATSPEALEQRRQRAAELKRQGESLPEIARALDVSRRTAAYDLERAARPGEPESQPEPDSTALEVRLTAEQLSVLDELCGDTPRIEWLRALLADALAPTPARRVRGLLARVAAAARGDGIPWGTAKAIEGVLGKLSGP